MSGRGMLTARGGGQVLAAVVMKYFSRWIISKGTRIKQTKQLNFSFHSPNNNQQLSLFTHQHIFEQNSRFHIRDGLTRYPS